MKKLICHFNHPRKKVFCALIVLFLQSLKYQPVHCDPDRIQDKQRAEKAHLLAEINRHQAAVDRYRGLQGKIACYAVECELNTSFWRNARGSLYIHQYFLLATPLLLALNPPAILGYSFLTYSISSTIVWFWNHGIQSGVVSFSEDDEVSSKEREFMAEYARVDSKGASELAVLYHRRATRRRCLFRIQMIWVALVMNSGPIFLICRIPIFARIWDLVRKQWPLASPRV